MDAPPELRRDDHLVPKRRDRLTEEVLIRERTVRFGAVEQRHARLNRRTDDLDSLLPVGRGPIHTRQPHAAVSHGGHLQALPQIALAHESCSYGRGMIVTAAPSP